MVAAGILLVSPGACSETLDRVVASVDYQAITDRDVEIEYRYEQILNGKQPGRTPDAPTRNAVRDRLVEQALLAQEIPDSHLPPVTQDTLAGDLAGIQKKFAGPEAFEGALKEAGINTRQLLDRLRLGDSISALIDARLRPQAWVEQSEIETYFNETFLPTFKQQNPGPPPSLDEVKDKIRAILTEEKINKLLDEWISDLKARHRVELRSM